MQVMYSHFFRAFLLKQLPAMAKNVTMRPMRVIQNSKVVADSCCYSKGWTAKQRAETRYEAS